MRSTPEGVAKVVKHEAKDRATHEKFVAAGKSLGQEWMALNSTRADVVPAYYECGRAATQAWGQAADYPCSDRAYQAADVMRDAMPVCKKLRDGGKYEASYRDLLHDQDVWCGFPGCKVPECEDEDDCRRRFEFPHEPKCYGPVVHHDAK